MCNSYTISRRQRERVPSLVQPSSEAINAIIGDWEAPRLIRPTNAAPVLLPDNEARLMRWGFNRRPKVAYPLNNARTDNLGHHFWKQAWVERRRCLVPVDGYYEYTGPDGNKQAHLFHAPSAEGPGTGPWLWAAAIWEEHPEVGGCFSMLMTEAAGIVTSIHDRMPVLLTPADFERFLAAETAAELLFPSIPLAVADVENPLKRKKAPERAPRPAPPPPPQQGELF